jgi:hypothetical protein
MRLPPDERRAARAERQVERQLRRDLDNERYAAGRAASIEAESRRGSADSFDHHP